MPDGEGAAEVFKYSNHLDLTERAPHCAPFWYKAERARLGGQVAARNRRRKLADEFRARNSNDN